MLTEQQVEFIERLSGGAWFGVVMGAVCGLLVTAAMLIKQGRRRSGIEGFVGLLYGVVPGAMAAAIMAILVAAIAVPLERNYCEPGPKGGYVIPDGLASLILVVSMFVCLFAAGIAARLAIPDVGTKQQPWSEVRGSAITWSALGALIGAIAGIGRGFDGYFVVQSNAGPICCAIAGAAFLAVGSLLWRMTTGLIDRPEQPLTEEIPSTQQRVRTRMVLVLAWSVFLFMLGVSTFGTIGVAFVLGTALWIGVIIVGRLNVRLAWLLFVVFFAAQPPMIAFSRSGWSLVLSDSNAFSQLDTIGDALHLLSLAVCGPLVWMVVNMRWDEFNPMLYILALPSIAVFQGGVVWWIGDIILRRQVTTRRHWLAVLTLAVILLFGCAFMVQCHLL